MSQNANINDLTRQFLFKSDVEQREKSEDPPEQENEVHRYGNNCQIHFHEWNELIITIICRLYIMRIAV